MKKSIAKMIAVAFLGMTALSFTQCKKIVEAIKVDVPIYLEFDFEIPASSDMDEIVLNNTVYFNVDSSIKAAHEKLGAHNIKDAKIEVAHVFIDPAEQLSDANLLNIDYISEHFSSDLKPEKEKIAEVAEFSDPYNVELTVYNPTDLKEYLNTRTFHFETKTKLKSPIEQPIKAHAKVKLILKAGL